MAKGVGGWLTDPKVFAETLTGIKLYGGDDNRKFFGTKEKPGPAPPDDEIRDRHLVVA